MYDTRRLSQWNGVANSCRDGRGNLALTGVAPVGRPGGSGHAVPSRIDTPPEPISLADRQPPPKPCRHRRSTSIDTPPSIASEIRARRSLAVIHIYIRHSVLSLAVLPRGQTAKFLRRRVEAALEQYERFDG